jgi:glycosyltransferase involved in cell wall biosynthesis
MKILCVNSVISEYGGAEFAAMNLALGLANRGHEIHFLGAKDEISPMEDHGHEARGLGGNDKIKFYHRNFPRIYPLGEKHGNLRKIIWHIQDVIHPTNETLFAEVLGQVRPEAIILHNVTAVGWNIWRTIRKSRIPCVQVIHDLGLICLNKARFKAARQCSGLCTACRLQKVLRFSMIADAPNFSFVSPSRALLQEIERHVDLSRWKREVIPNPNTFTVKQRSSLAVEKPRLLYVGRIDPLKGLDAMLRSAERAHKIVDFDLDILGAGSLELPLRQRYASQSWIRFHGAVDQEDVAEFMSRATVLLIPSLWLENAPVTVVHALFAGLPALGSHIGGIPEYLLDGRTGRLLPPGDENAWSAEIVRVLSDREQVATWSTACFEAAQRYHARYALDAYERLINAMIIDTRGQLMAQ